MDKLLYMNAECEFYVTPLGFTYCNGIAQYNGAVLRNKVMLKVSLDEIICRKYYLSDLSVDKYSSLLIQVLTGLIPVDQASGVLKLFYKEDLKFRRYLAEFYYTRYSVSSIDPTFLGLLSNDLRKYVEEEIREFHATTKGAINDVYSRMTGTDIYFAVDENLSQTIEIKSKYKVEVVSNAKNWVGKIQVID